MKTTVASFLRHKLSLLAIAALCMAPLTQVSATPPSEPLTPTTDVKTGMTSLVFDAAFDSILTGLTAEKAKIIPGQFVKGRQTYRFPIRGGAFDLDTLESEFVHTGGVKISTDLVDVSLTDLIITLPAAPENPMDPIPASTLSALVTVDGHLLGRITLFNLDAAGAGLAKPHNLPKNKKLSLDNIDLTLTAEGAATLNTAFEVDTFLEDSAVGTISINAITASRRL